MFCRYLGCKHALEFRDNDKRVAMAHRGMHDQVLVGIQRIQPSTMLGISAAVAVNSTICYRARHSAACDLTSENSPSMTRAAGAGNCSLNFAVSSAMRAWICAVSLKSGVTSCCTLTRWVVSTA